MTELNQKIDFTGIPKNPKIDFTNIPKAIKRKQGDEITSEQKSMLKEQMEGAYKTAKAIGHVYPIAETAASLVTQIYGLPISGIAGLLSSPLNFIWKDTNEKVLETVQDWLIYKPQTKKGEHLTEATFYPFQKLDELGGLAGNKVLKETGSPTAAALVHTAIMGAPAIMGLRYIPGRVMNVIKSSEFWKQSSPKTRALVVQNLEELIKRNPSMTEGEILKNYDNVKGTLYAEAQAKRVIKKEPIKAEPPKSEAAKLEKLIVEEEPKVSELEAAFNKNKEIFFQERDEALFRANVESRLLQKDLKSALDLKRYSKPAQDIDKAIQLYIDTKRNPAHVEEFYDKLTDEQKAVVDLSKDLPENVIPIVDKIDASYRAVGLDAYDAEIIRNILDNYAGRIWDLGDKPSTEISRKFGTTTRHAKQRVFETIIEGWVEGYELKVEGAINNLKILKEEIVRTIANKNFLKAMQKIKDVDGNKLITDKHLEGYKQIEHPNFVSWKWAGKVKEGEIYGKNTFIDDEGNVFEKRVLYAPKKQADNLNNIFGVSKIKYVKFGPISVANITKYNAIAKAWILQTSLFHHLAFLRSYYLPGLSPKKWSELTPKGAFNQGMEAIERLDPIIVLGVRNGLTLGVRQDWDEALLREKTIFGRVLDKTKATKQVKDSITKLRELQSDWLFGEMGASLKSKMFIIEYREQLKKRPTDNPDIIAREVASMVNDDFGGLHLERMGRDPTLQHILRLMLLAPDWTESNVRTMVKMFPMGKDGSRYYTSKAAGKMYRKFWLGMLIKGMGATILLNAILSGFDLDKLLDNYKAAWKAGNLKALGVDITPIYKALGGKSPTKKYFYLIGHFRDPIKFVTHPVRSAHHKGSVVYGIFHEALAGIDWAGREFTTFNDLLHEGKTVKWGQSGPLEWDQLPSYLISQLIGVQPIQIQNLLAWMAGEQGAFEAIANSLGLGVVTTHQKRKKDIR